MSALAECCIINEEKMVGAEINIPIKSRNDFSYFSETQSRIIVSVSPDNKAEFGKLIQSSKQPFSHIGKVGGSSLKINNDINITVDKLADLYFNTISRIMSGEK